MPIPADLCQRCTGPLGEDVYLAERDRVCALCASRARDRGEPVEPVTAGAELLDSACEGLSPGEQAFVRRFASQPRSRGRGGP